MKLLKLLENSEIFDTTNIPDIEIGEIVTNSLKASEDSLFICLEGLNEDGHKYIHDALMRGAAAVVMNKNTKFEPPQYAKKAIFIYCDDTRRAAAELYHCWYGKPSEKLKIIAVTGTNGKTSVTFMLKAIFEAALYKCGIIGTVECKSGTRQLCAAPDDPLANLTTPDPPELYRTLAFMAADGVDYVFIEASSHALKLSKLDALTFDTAIFTNLTPEHLDFHNNMDDYRESKSKLFEKSRLALINADDKSGEYMKSKCKGKTYTYSAKGNAADFCAESVSVSNALCEKKTMSQSSFGINYTLNSKNTIMKIRSRLEGAFNIDNTLCAAACAILHGISPPLIYGALMSLGEINGRMERVKLPIEADFSVYVDYAHTPDALKNLLMSAKGLVKNNGRIVLLFGCGGDRDKTKRSAMAEVASEFSDVTIITSDNSRSEDRDKIIKDILQGMRSDHRYLVIPDRKAAIEQAVLNAMPNDLILLAGKGHEKYEIDNSGKHPFDEADIVIKAFEKKLGKVER